MVKASNPPSSCPFEWSRKTWQSLEALRRNIREGCTEENWSVALLIKHIPFKTKAAVRYLKPYIPPLFVNDTDDEVMSYRY